LSAERISEPQITSHNDCGQAVNQCGQSVDDPEGSSMDCPYGRVARFIGCPHEAVCQPKNKKLVALCATPFLQKERIGNLPILHCQKIGGHYAPLFKIRHCAGFRRKEDNDNNSIQTTQP